MILRSFPEHVEHVLSSVRTGDSFCSLSPKKHGMFWGFKIQILRHVAWDILRSSTCWKCSRPEQVKQIPQSHPMHIHHYPSWLRRTLARARRTSSPTKMTWFGRQTPLRVSRATRRTTQNREVGGVGPDFVDHILKICISIIIMCVYVYVSVYVHVHVHVHVYVYVYVYVYI